MLDFAPKPMRLNLTAFALLAFSLATAGTGGVAQLWDRVATARLEIPPYMVSYAALCEDERNSALHVVRHICESERPATYAVNGYPLLK